jgi:HEAT repeat protein
MIKEPLFAALFFFALSAQAALPPQSTHALEEAYDVLSMPDGNQKQVAQGKADVLYPALIRISRSSTESMQTRWRALTLASSLKSQEVLPELEQALSAPEWFMRNAALVSLEQYHPKRAQTAAQALLKDKALVVRSAAVQVLGKKMDDKTRDLFWEQLASAQNFRRKQSLWIRGQMLSLLAESPQSRETGLFAKALNDDDVKIQAPAIAALEKLTQKVLGTHKTALSEKRALWVQWAKSRPSGTL